MDQNTFQLQQQNQSGQQPTQQSMMLALQAQMQMGAAGGALGQNPPTNAVGDGTNQQGGISNVGTGLSNIPGGGGGAPAGLPAHMLVGATPFQQQLSALQGLTSGQSQPPNNQQLTLPQPGVGTNPAQQQPQQGNTANGNNNNLHSQLGQHLLGGGLQQLQQQMNGSAPMDPAARLQALQQQTVGGITNASGNHNIDEKDIKTDDNAASAQLLGNGNNSTQGGSLLNADSLAQQGGQFGAGGMMGGLNQNALLSVAAVGGGNNMGFNLQQLQLAQQLMAAGLPPNLALNGIGQQQNSVNGAGGANANVMGQLGGISAPGTTGLNSIGGMGSSAVTGSAPSLGNVLGSNVAVAQSALAVGGLGAGAKPEATAKSPHLDGAVPSQNPSKAGQPDWAEPFAGKGKKEPPFPLKLHQILSNPEFQECIVWNPHGRSWRILKPPVFEQLVIPLYFRHAKYASFMRQVNGWGFKRIVSGNDHNSYFHELFLRDYPQLCLKMKRIRKGEKPEEAQGVDIEQETGGEMVEEVIDGKEGDSNEGSDKGDNSNGSGLGKKKKPKSGKGAAGNAILEGDQSASSAQTLASLGIIPRTTGLATAAPGYNALAGLQSQMQNGNSSILQQQQEANGVSTLNSLSSLQNKAANNPSQGVGAVTQGALDSSALLKLQQALQLGGASSILQQQQPQAQPPAPSTQGFNLSNLNFLQGSMGGTLAAQLQAATQAPQRTGEPNDNNNTPGSNT